MVERYTTTWHPFQYIPVFRKCEQFDGTSKMVHIRGYGVDAFFGGCQVFSQKGIQEERKNKVLVFFNLTKGTILLTD